MTCRNYIRELRERLSEMQGHRCAYCCCDIRHGATLEHLRPRSRGGPTNYENCVAACLPCNRGRGNTGSWDWYKAVKYIRRAIKLRWIPA